MPNSNAIVIQKGRTNIIPVSLSIDITGETITSQIRSEPNQESTLIATFTVVVVDAATGELTLTLDDTVAGAIIYKTGYMDLKRVSGGEALSVFDAPLDVEFRGTVTA